MTVQSVKDGFVGGGRLGDEAWAAKYFMCRWTPASAIVAWSAVASAALTKPCAVASGSDAVVLPDLVDVAGSGAIHACSNPGSLDGILPVLERVRGWGKDVNVKREEEMLRGGRKSSTYSLLRALILPRSRS